MAISPPEITIIKNKKIKPCELSKKMEEKKKFKFIDKKTVSIATIK